MSGLNFLAVVLQTFTALRTIREKNETSVQRNFLSNLGTLLYSNARTLLLNNLCGQYEVMWNHELLGVQPICRS
jgi:hypothetical protein